MSKDLLDDIFITDEGEVGYTRSVVNQSAAQMGSAQNVNYQEATNVAKATMDNFLDKANRSRNMDYEKAKGFLFENIEGAKLETNIAESGAQAPDVHVVTDTPVESGGAGNPHDPSDFRLMRDGRTVSQGQAKVYNNPTDAARALLDPKYANDQFVVPKDQVEAVRANLQKRYENGSITKAEYKRGIRNLDAASEGFKDTETGITSGGTTTRELEEMRGKDGKVSQRGAKNYADRFNFKTGMSEIGHTALASAAAGAAISGAVTLVKGSVEALIADDDFEDVMLKTAAATADAGIRGGVTGAIGAGIRVAGTNFGSTFLMNPTYSMAIAGGLVDISGSLMDFVNGRIDSETFAYSACRACTTAVSTGLIGKLIAEKSAVGIIVPDTGVVSAGFVRNVVMPLSEMTVISYIVGAAFSVLQSEHLRAVEAQRIEAIYLESLRQLNEMHGQIERLFNQYKLERFTQFCEFFSGMIGALHEYGVESYDDMMRSIKKLANDLDIKLKHPEYDGFCEMMLKKS